MKERLMLNLDVDPYKITSDSYNFILNRKIISKRGKETLEVVGYYATLEGVLRRLVGEAVGDSDVETVQQLVDKLEAVQAQISEAVKKL